MMKQNKSHLIKQKKIFPIIMSLSIAVSMGSFAMDIYIPFIPFIGPELLATSNQVQWTLSIFMIFMALGQLFIGPLSDHYGQKKLLLISSLCFTLGSLLASVTMKISIFLISRALQAIGACGGYAVSIAYVQQYFEDKQVEKLLGAFVCLNGLGPICAPILGTKLGLMFQTWRASFVYLSITGIISTILIVLFLEKDSISKGKDSFPSLEEIKNIFFHEHFQKWFLVLATVMTGLFTFFSLSTYYLQQTHGYSMSQYSALFALQGMIYTAGSLSRNFLFSKIKTPKLIILSLFGLTFLSLLLCFHPLVPGQPILLFLLCSYLMAFLYGLILGPSTGLLLAPFKKRAGTSAAISGCLQFSIAPMMASLFVLPPIESGLNYGLPLLLLSCLSLYKIGRQEIILNLKEKM